MVQKTPAPKQPEQPQIQQEQLKFQWSIFVDAGKREQFVIRCNDFGDLLTERDLVLELIDQEVETRQPQQPDPENDPSFCAIHTTQMRQRTGKNGNTWFDHRWQDADEQWHICNGKSETIQQPR